MTWLRRLSAGLPVLLVAGSVWAQAVAIPDSHLRTSLRVAFGKTAGAMVTPRELATVTELDLSAAGIRDLQGLEDARNLAVLRLRNNAVSTLAPLADLGLEYLDIGGNEITDLTPLAGLPALREVRLGSNPVQDFSPLAPLVRTGLLVVWRPDAPSGSRTIRVDVDSPMLAAKTMFLLAPAQAAAADYAAAAQRGYIEVAVTDDALELALRTGQRVAVVDPVSGAPPPSAAEAVDIQAATVSRAARRVEAGGIPGFACYRTVEETYASAHALATAYPSLVEWSDVGDSWKKTQDSAEGYDLMVLRLTNEARTGAKPVLFITSALHAREYTIAELTTRFAEQLVAGYGTDADATWLLDHHEVHLLLHVNPDGRKRAEAGLLWRKNHNTAHCSADANQEDQWLGVDLNRNFDFKWGLRPGSSLWTCDETYHGSAADSEPETQAVVEYMASLFPDKRGPQDTDAAAADTSGVYLDIHSYSKVILYPWMHTVESPAPNGPQLRTLGRKLGFFSNYPAMQSFVHLVSGSAVDYAYGALGVASYTFEIGTSFFQDCGSFERTVLPDNLAALRYALTVARTPYITPAGPDAVGVTTSAGSPTTAVSAGAPVALSATFNDSRYNTKGFLFPDQESSPPEATWPIAGGEYYVDVPPWEENATAVALTATDGGWDTTEEAAGASIDTTGWSEGQHLIFVRGKDSGADSAATSDDTWGAFSAAFVYIGLPAPAAPNVMAVSGTTDALAVTWTAPSRPANASAITGYDLRYIRADALNKTDANWTELPSAWTTGALAFTISGLEAGEYEVAVRAVGSDARSTFWSPSTRQRTANRAPTFPNDNAAQTRTLDEGVAAAALLIGPPVEATDPDSDQLTYRLSGTDAGDFDIDTGSGQLSTRPGERYDFETKAHYAVVVSAADPLGLEAKVQVTISLINRDEPGVMTLRPTRPRVGRQVRASLNDADGGISNETWVWERSRDGQTWSPIDGATGNTYTPGAAERGFRLRVGVNYDDGHGPGKRAQAETEAVSDPPPPPPPPRQPGPPGNGDGGGGGGGSRTPDDRHGDTWDAATALTPAGHTGALARTITAHLQDRRDVDYFTLLLPYAGVLTAATTGGTDTTGRLYQAQEDDAPLLVTDAADGGAGRNFALGAALEPGTYYLVVSAGTGSGEYTLYVHYTPAFFENPAPNAPQSGVSVLSGWVCEADTVEIALTPARGTPVTLLPATGTARADTAGVCGAATTDTGFGLLFNWNLLGDGAHMVRVLIDDVLFAERQITVTTLGEHEEQEFRRGLRGTSTISDFPDMGQTTTLRWEEALQNFVIASGEGSDGGAQLTPEQARLEKPRAGVVPEWSGCHLRLGV